jgi:lipoate-protein ligase A
MDKPLCRLLPYHVADGPWNMAADEALLEAAVAGTASFRLYGWRTATLSLGYFQGEAACRADGRLAALPWVRRPSGGSALVHHHEVTYALALPAGPPWQKRGESWLLRMHAVIGRALGRAGVEVQASGVERKQGEVLCFLHHTPGDLVCGTAKVGGSAQRRQRGAVLQHGGILLAQSPFTPELPGIRELTGKDLAGQEWRSLLVDQLARDTGWRLEPGDWTKAEHGRIEALRVERYLQDSWNRKR